MNPEAHRDYLPTSGGTWLLPLQVGGGLSVAFLLCLVVELGHFQWFQASTLLLASASACFLLVKTGPAMDLLHPVRVFGSLWCFCLSLASMRLIPVISDWNFLMWSCVITGLVSFVAGFTLARGLWSARNTRSKVETSDQGLQNYSLPSRKALVVAALCVATGFIVLAYEYHLIGGIPLLPKT